MLGGITRLTTKSDVLTPLITLLLCVLIGGLLSIPVHSTSGKIVVLAIFAGIFLVVAGATVRSLAARAGKLRSGHCPYPLCHGAVHHSEHVPRGHVVCLTCQRVWPEIPGMHFRVTGRDR